MAASCQAYITPAGAEGLPPEQGWYPIANVSYLCNFKFSRNHIRKGREGEINFNNVLYLTHYIIRWLHWLGNQYENDWDIDILFS